MERRSPAAAIWLRIAICIVAAAAASALLVRWVSAPAAAALGAAAGLVAGWFLLGRLPRMADALTDALSSLRERDYAVRLEPSAAGYLSRIATRFNDLAEALRREKNDVYQKELLLETVLEAAPVAITLVGEDGTIALANGAARDLLGDGRRLSGASLDAVLAGCAAEVAEALRGRADAMFTVEKDGERHTLLAETRWFELNTERHRLILMKPFTRELERQEAEVWKKAIRVISHELANSLAPISSMIGSARTMAKMPEHAARLDGVLATVGDRARSLREFLEGYARFARLPRPAKQEVPWQEFLDGVRALYPFTIEGVLPAAPGFFDPAQLQQVLINLLKNAVESGSSPDQCALRIEQLPQGGAELIVMDRGAGMTDEVRRRALEPFYSTKRAGSGLGLPLCREIVEAHGGRLLLAARDGGGTAVRCRLPGPT